MINRLACAAILAATMGVATDGASRAALALDAPEIPEMRAATRDLLERAVLRFEVIGFEAAQIEFNDPTDDRWLRAPFHQHLFAMSRDGVVWADNVFPGLIGLDFSNILDADGLAFGRRILDETPEEGVFVIEIAFQHPDGGLAPGVGSCARPVAEHILCAWAEGAPQPADAH